MDNVIISNPGEFDRKKKSFVDGGKEKIHVLSDFDRTLTRASSGSIISRLSDERYLTEDYAPKYHALFDKYRPIETDLSIHQEEKNKKMYEWWKLSKELLIESGFDKPTIKRCINDVIKEDTLAFRNGIEEFFQYLRNNRIPLVIMSSSLEELINEFMKQKEVYSDNIYVIANSFEYENGKAVGIKKIVHVFNKHEMEVKDIPIYDELLKRENVLLLGDSMGDLGMIEGFPYKNLIKIGFLNENVKENLEKYKCDYDIVILNDGDFSFVNGLVKEIINN